MLVPGLMVAAKAPQQSWLHCSVTGQVQLAAASAGAHEVQPRVSQPMSLRCLEMELVRLVACFVAGHQGELAQAPQAF